MAKPMRAAVALSVSLALHVVLAAVMMGSQLVRLWPRSPAVEIEVVTTPPTALPLGDPAPAAAPPDPPPAAVVEAPEATKKKRPTKPPPNPPVTDAGADAGDVPDALPAPIVASDAGTSEGLRADGPEGARVVVRLRLDRLREAPRSAAFMALTDSLLRLLPDRRRLLDGSGLDLFNDFDALIVATPNPLDDAVTFLAVRHHLTDEALMLALGRAATGAGRPIEWTQKRDRPVGLRPSQVAQTRDDRLFVLPAPGWAVIAPQAYMALLLPELVVGPADTKPSEAETFDTLAARIRGEESAMPDTAVMHASMADMLRRRAGQNFVVPGAGPLPVPKRVAIAVALQPQPELELRLGFSERADAAAWAKVLPELRRQYAAHPLVLLGGMNAVVARVTVEERLEERPPLNATQGGDVVIKAPMTQLEAERILTLITNLLRGQRGQQ